MKTQIALEEQEDSYIDEIENRIGKIEGNLNVLLVGFIFIGFTILAFSFSKVGK